MGAMTLIRVCGFIKVINGTRTKPVKGSSDQNSNRQCTETAQTIQWNNCSVLSLWNWRFEHGQYDSPRKVSTQASPVHFVSVCHGRDSVAYTERRASCRFETAREFTGGFRMSMSQ